MKTLNTKSKLITFGKLLALAFVCALSVTAKVKPTFTPINLPGASSTQALGINPGGDVVGIYRDATGTQHGFLLSGEIFTTIDFPGAVFTSARGIGPGGDIVGSYGLAGEPPALTD